MKRKILVIGGSYMNLQMKVNPKTKQFYMDYFEFCPKEVYDNPETPEDIW